MMNDRTQPTAEKAIQPTRKKGLSSGELTLIGLFCGIGFGLFFGEEAARLKIIGDAYVRLLQMTVLPYIIFSLISKIGKLSIEQSKLLARRAGIALLILWGIGIVMIVTMPLALPPQLSASFFSSGLLESPREINLVKLFIPSNIFDALAENIVPAVVVFCIAAGIALIEVQNKQTVLEVFDVLSQVMTRVTKTLAKVAPVGVFAITANAAGTMTFEELGRLQGYLIIYTIAFLLLTFWVLPGLVASLTPFKYGEVISVSRKALILAFSTGKVLIVLPLIIENVKELFKKYKIQSQEAITTAEVIVPLAYPFPNLGKMLAMLFVPFAAWFMGKPMGLSDYALYISAGFPSFFGSVAVAMPFALDLMKLPADMFELFLVTGFYAANISDCLAAMHLIALTLMVACASSGTLHLRWKRVSIVLVSAVLLAGILLLGTRVYLAKTFEGSYHKDKVLASMHLLENPVPATIVEPAPNPVPLRPGQSRLTRIKERGAIRIGFSPDALPFSFFNVDNQLVGFDIELAYKLAQELGVKIEFVPIVKRASLKSYLEVDYFDIAVGGFAATIKRSQEVQFSAPYLYLTMALVVPDSRDVEFASVKSINQLKTLKIGGLSKFLTLIKLYFPQAEMVSLNSPRDFFEEKGSGKGLDALLTSAEEGSAWTLIYPHFQVVTPFQSEISIPLVYPHGGDNDNLMEEFLDNWLLVKTKDGTINRVYDYWILGQGSQSRKPRWSIIRDVLHWVN